MTKAISLAEKLDRHSIPEPMSGCWLWLARTNENGYGMLTIDGIPKLAHRLSWERSGRLLVPGLVLDHRCRVRSCINPEHLRQVTQKENLLASGETLSGANARKTHCPQGHEYDWISGGNRPGRRLCKQCKYKQIEAARKRRRARQRD